jgi:hypothetical protein
MNQFELILSKPISGVQATKITALDGVEEVVLNEKRIKVFSNTNNLPKLIQKVGEEINKIK